MNTSGWLEEIVKMLGEIRDRLPAVEVGDDRGEDYRPVSRDMVGEMRGMWVDEIGEAHWVTVDAAYEHVASGRGWKRAYVRRDGR